MIKKITIKNPKGELLILELRHPEKSGVIVESVTGLGFPKSDISSASLAVSDGGIFNRARVDTRNIVLNLIPMWNPIVEYSRHQIYRAFPIKKKVEIEFETDYRVSSIEGYVESCEADIFSSNETIQVSIVCVDPWLYAQKRSEQLFTGTTPLFEFPFGNESLDKDLIEFGNIRLDTSADLQYSGDVDTGVEIIVHALGPAENITLVNNNTREQIKIDTLKVQQISGSPFSTGDDIIINTKIGQRSVMLLRDGVYTSVLGAVNKDIDWFQISPGINVFSFTATSGENDLQVTFNYRDAYGGV